MDDAQNLSKLDFSGASKYPEPKLFDNSIVMTTSQTADFLKVSKKFLYRLIHDGEIPYRKVGRKEYRFLRSELIDWLKGA